MERFGFVRGLTNFCSRCTDAAGSTTQCGLNFVLKLVKVILLGAFWDELELASSCSGFVAEQLLASTVRADAN